MGRALARIIGNLRWSLSNIWEKLECFCVLPSIGIEVKLYLVTRGSKEKCVHGKALHFLMISRESSKIKNAENMALILERACPCCTSLANSQNFSWEKCQEDHFSKREQKHGRPA